MKATVVMAVAFVVISCQNKLKTTKGLSCEDIPVQVVEGMFVVQSNNGKLQMRMESPRMERYENDTLSWELFPIGFKAYSYDEEGLLEAEIISDKAEHRKPKRGKETWSAYGNVTVKNLIKRETMETDTLYWDKNNERIYTDCYVRLLSPSGFMQGYGMESDQRARNNIIYKPFNNYALLEQDSTKVVLDTVNFIGPFPKI